MEKSSYGRRGIRSVLVDVAEGMAASTSILCLIHCLALPVIILALPAVLAPFALSEMVHAVLLATVVPFAFAAFWIGYRHHRHLVPAVLGAVGLASLAAGLSPFAAPLQAPLTIAGSLLLLAGHFRNWRLRAHAA